MSEEKEESLKRELEEYKRKVKKLNKKLGTQGATERYISTWFQVTSGNLYTRRQIVDTKSGLMITVNSIIISILLGSLYPRLGEDPHLVWGLVPMILANVLSITYAIFATRPVFGHGKFTRDDVDNRSANLNTFDDFYKMPEKDYKKAVYEMMNESTFIHNTYIRENHRLGVDLARRYHNIRISYHIFLTGLITAIAAFAICHLIYD